MNAKKKEAGAAKAAADNASGDGVKTAFTAAATEEAALKDSQLALGAMTKQVKDLQGQQMTASAAAEVQI